MMEDTVRPPSWRTLLPWLLLAAAPASDLIRGKVALPWLAGAALIAFVPLYATTIRTVLAGEDEGGARAWWQLGALTLLGYAPAIAYGDNWLVLLVLIALASGTLLRRRLLAANAIALSLSSVAISFGHGDSPGEALSSFYGPLLAAFVCAAVVRAFALAERLSATRQELARAAVEQERLRFSRDLHDLLGHTLSVIVVKAEAVRRLAPQDTEAAVGQAADIEAVGRQALTEIREAVTGYRQGSLSAELDRARALLAESGIEPVVSRAGPPLPPQTETLLGWVVREGVTNVLRHSGAGSCEIALRGDEGQVRLVLTDDGRGPAAAGPPDGNGLLGLRERLAAAGGSLESGPAGRRGFRLTAVLPLDSEEPLAAARQLDEPR